MTQMPSPPRWLFIPTILCSTFLFLAIGTAHFYDPTLFHPLYPHGGIQNWLGLFGALTGGTLIELFGPPALLIPWFFFRLVRPVNRKMRKPVLAYYGFVFILTISILYALWLPSDRFPIGKSLFWLHTGYLGVLGAQWLSLTLTSVGANVVTVVVFTICGMKLYEELPIKPLLSMVFVTVVLLPLYCLEHLRDRVLPEISKQWTQYREQKRQKGKQQNEDLDSDPDPFLHEEFSPEEFRPEPEFEEAWETKSTHRDLV